MASTAYLQVLRAALDLRSFTARDLAEQSAVPLESVRTIIKRNPSVFDDAGTDTQVPSARRSGRPARSYRLRDPESARREIETLPGRMPTERRSPDDALLNLTRANLRAAFAGESDAQRIEMAEHTARTVLNMSDIGNRSRARAHTYLAIGQIARAVLLRDSPALATAADEGARALRLDQASGQRVARLLLAAATKTGVAPPIAELSVEAGVARTPDYAESLLRAGSSAALVVRVGIDEDLPPVARALEGLRSLNVPVYVVVASEHRSWRTFHSVAVATGAYLLPAEATPENFPTAWVANALDKMIDLGDDKLLLDALEAVPDLHETSAVAPPMPPLTVPNPGRPSSRASSVVVVDHDPRVRHLMRDALMHADFGIVVEASTGSEAIELARFHGPDIMVLGALNPEIDRVDLARRLNALDPSIRVVMLVGAGEEETGSRASPAGAAGYISSDEDFPQAVRQVAGSEVVTSSAMTVVERLRGTAREPLHSELTTREHEVLSLLAAGATTTEIAERLTLSGKAVHTYVEALYRKLTAESSALTILRANDLRWLSPHRS